MREQPQHLTKRQKRDAMARKKEERAVKTYHKKQKEAQKYAGQDDGYVSFSAQLAEMGLQLRDIAGDGNCLYRALGDQFDDSKRHREHRQDTCSYMEEHRADFEPFVEDDVPFDRHMANLKKVGTYAGNDAIVAFSRLHKVNVVIHQLNSPCWEIHGSDDEKARQLHISYHNGDHYSSVRKIGDYSNTPTNIRIKIAGSSSTPEIPEWQKKQQEEEELYKQQEEEEENGYQHSQHSSDDLYGDICDLEDKVMEETGCKDRAMVRQALQDSGFSMDGAVMFLLQIMATMPEHHFLDEVDGYSHEHTPEPTTSSGAKPKKTARQKAKEKKLEKQKKAMARHKNKHLNQQQQTNNHTDSDSDEQVIIETINTLKI